MVIQLNCSLILQKNKLLGLGPRLLEQEQKRTEQGIKEKLRTQQTTLQKCIVRKSFCLDVLHIRLS